ncbi:MAG: ParB/RepB/Spo0J family partition protein [Clostridiales Family XIII bacterium]|jgi:ParB family chromosome partitioning protein|nr:ParB/RepB/Spo0J family partition protein [Clostridiales Family XIII bacterium]
MVAKKKALGRGLDALFGEIEQARPVNRDEDASSASGSDSEALSEDEFDEDKIVYIEIDDIKPNAMQPRQKFAPSEIEELAKSIEEHGVIQPVILRRSENGFEMVAGERRWRAARKAGLRRLPAIVRALDDTENALIALIENMQRVDLNPIEEAEAFENVIEKHKLTQDALAKTVGKSRPYISNTLRIVRMPVEIVEFVRSGALSRGHANAIGSIKDKDKQLEISRFIVKNGLSVREAELLCAKAVDGAAAGKEKRKRAKEDGKSPELRAVEDELTTLLGARVLVNSPGSSESGKLEIHYFNKEELNDLIDTLRGLR